MSKPTMPNAWPGMTATESDSDDPGNRLAIAEVTLRDYFAGQVMVGITQALAQGVRPHDVPKMAADAYFLADAMLKARQA